MAGSRLELACDFRLPACLSATSRHSLKLGTNCRSEYHYGVKRESSKIIEAKRVVSQARRRVLARKSWQATIGSILNYSLVSLTFIVLFVSTAALPLFVCPLSLSLSFRPLTRTHICDPSPFAELRPHLHCFSSVPTSVRTPLGTILASASKCQDPCMCTASHGVTFLLSVSASLRLWPLPVESRRIGQQGRDLGAQFEEQDDGAKTKDEWLFGAPHCLAGAPRQPATVVHFRSRASGQC